jgi:hypothetical protein
MPSDERVAASQTRALVASAADDVHMLALSGAGTRKLEERLADLELRAAGRKSRACRILAEQIHLWFDSHDADRATALSRRAIADHIAAAMFRNSDQRMKFKDGEMPAGGTNRSPE